MTARSPLYLPALTVRQPYASLLMTGAKRYETRSWRTHYRGDVAIHASARPVVPGLPTRAVLGLARLVAVHRVEDLTLTDDERGRGDFTPGRFAWEFTDRRPLRTLVPCSGTLGLWPLSDDLARLIRRALD